MGLPEALKDRLGGHAQTLAGLLVEYGGGITASNTVNNASHA